MTGRVRNLHVLLPVPFRLPGRPDIAIEFVMDTGFTGALTLPAAAVAALGLPLLREQPAILADGSLIELSVYAANVLWHGSEVVADVLATGDRPLLGTALLDGSGLDVQFTEGGLVNLDPL